jgi:hypothetical protein
VVGGGQVGEEDADGAHAVVQVVQQVSHLRSVGAM